MTFEGIRRDISNYDGKLSNVQVEVTKNVYPDAEVRSEQIKRI
jgi:hypothetical protein